MLLSRAAVERANEILKPDDFYRDAHRFIFEAIMSISQNDEPVEVLTVIEELRFRSKLDSIGGENYLLVLLDAPTTAANVEYYAKLVEEKSLLRRLMDAGSQIQGLAYSEFDSVDEVVDKAERIIFDVGQRRTGQFFAELRPLLDQELDRIEKRYENRGITTGRQTPFDDLNYKTSGLQPRRPDYRCGASCNGENLAFGTTRAVYCNERKYPGRDFQSRNVERAVSRPYDLLRSEGRLESLAKRQFATRRLGESRGCD